MTKEEQWLLQEKYHGKKTKTFYQDAKRLKTGEPLDFIIGFVEFLDCKIDLSKRPLIPRFETEFWAQQVIEELKSKREFLRVLDIFSGSGCIGLSIVRHIPNSHVTFADVESNCIEQIKINCRLNKVSTQRYQIIQSDLFNNITGQYDCIVANPPYIPIKNKDKVQSSVLGYESPIALFGGNDGLLYVEKFLRQAKAFLKPQGKIYMELDSPQKESIEKILQEAGYAKWEFCKDQYQDIRYVAIQNM